jgi:hypothetical protein
LGAFFAVSPQKTGLSAPIKTPFTPKAGVWGFAPNSENKNARAFLFRFYPLRGRKPSAFALGVLLRKTPGAAFQAVFVLRSLRWEDGAALFRPIYGKEYVVDP